MAADVDLDDETAKRLNRADADIDAVCQRLLTRNIVDAWELAIVLQDVTTRYAEPYTACGESEGIVPLPWQRLSVN